MSYSHETSTVVFSGDVRVKRPDFTLWCQELTVHVRREAARALQSEESGGTSGSGAQDLSRQFEKIIAEKEVRLVMSDREATGSKAVYQAETQTLTLQGEVVLKEGKNRIQGEKVTFYMDEDRTEIDSGGQDQVKALFFPSEDGESADGVPSGLQSE